MHEADLHIGGNPAGKQLSTSRHEPLFSGGLPSTSWRVWVRGPLSSDEISYPGSSDAVLLIYSSGGPPRALLINLFAHFSSAALRQSLFSLFGSLFFIFSSTTVISSSTTVIRPPIRALFDPNVIQPPIKWIWQLKILF